LKKYESINMPLLNNSSRIIKGCRNTGGEADHV